MAAKPATAKKELEKPETERRIMTKPAAVKKEPVNHMVEKKVAVMAEKKA
jgi:hypothetical protein